MKKRGLFLLILTLFAVLLAVNCQKVRFAYITFNNIGQYEAVVKVAAAYAYLSVGESYTFEVSWKSKSTTTARIRAYPNTGNIEDYNRGLNETVELQHGDHLYYDVDVVPLSVKKEG